MTKPASALGGARLGSPPLAENGIVLTEHPRAPPATGADGGPSPRGAGGPGTSRGPTVASWRQLMPPVQVQVDWLQVVPEGHPPQFALHTQVQLAGSAS